MNSRTGSPLRKTAYRAANALDATPASPAWWSGRVNAVLARRRTAAAERWHAAAGTTRPRRDTDEPLVGLQWLDDLIAESELELRLVPPGPLDAAAARLRRAGYARLLSRAVLATQMARHGWCETDLWSLDGPLCRRLGAQLQAMADVAPGWPCGEEFPEFEDWTAALRRHGAQLSAYAADRDEREEVYAAAQESLRWVADHLGNLWT